MYKYQCSKQECGSVWSLDEGNLNGFVLTCPICGKGRGLFVSQVKTQKEEQGEKIVISVAPHSKLTLEEINMKVDEFIQRHSLNVLSKKVESIENEIISVIHYRLKN